MNQYLYRIFRTGLFTEPAAAALQAYKRVKLALTDFRYEAAADPTITKEELLDYNRHRKFTADKVLCYAPKKSMLFSFDGNVYLCCDNKRDSIGHVNQDTLHDIWFGKKRAFLDKKINTDYNLGHGCATCNHKIKHRNYSTVQAQNFDLYTRNHSDYPARLEFEIQNTCNLECVMCSAIYSSSIQANRNKQPAQTPVYGDAFLQQLEAFYPHLVSINLLGGEPTLIKPYHTIIERLQDLNPDCFIHLQTNAGTLNSKFRKLLERPGAHFEIGVSMDSLDAELAERIRVNLDYKQFRENLQFYIGLHERGRIKLTINTCPMPENRDQLVPIIRFCNEHRLPVFLCVVNAPYYNTFLSEGEAFIRDTIDQLRAALPDLPRKGYYERNNYRQLEDFLHMLESWLPAARDYTERQKALSAYTSDALYALYEDRLRELIVYEDKDALIRQSMEHIRHTFEPLDEAVRRELCITLLNVTQDPILVSSGNEHMRWAREYVNTLVFSHQRRASRGGRG